MYALFEKVDDTRIIGKQRIVAKRYQVPSDFSANRTSLRHPFPTVDSVEESNVESESAPTARTNNEEIEVDREDILFVFLDRNTPVNREFLGPLRAINDDVQLFSNLTKCFNRLQTTNGKIFFITTSNEKEVIKLAHDCPAVEAIFVWNSVNEIDQIRFPKFVGAYKHSEELVKSLRNALAWFEQTQLDFISFEGEQLFLWMQLWRECIRPSHPRVTSKKKTFVDMAERYYRGNLKFIQCLDDFDYHYEANDALQWCFTSPVPSRFLRHALSSRDMEQIDQCRFLINDITRILYKPTAQKGNRQFYRGMKVTQEGLEKLVKYTGKLICPKGFLTCYKSRKVALDLARTPDYRPDLRSVLFKINCPPSVPLGEVPSTGAAGLVVLDVYFAFRIKIVDCGPVAVVKLEPAHDAGRYLVRAYRGQHKSEHVYTLLDQLSTLPAPPPREVSLHVQLKKDGPASPSAEELHAQKLIEQGRINEGLKAYQNLKRQSPRVLNIIGQLYADKKGDYDTALKYHQRAFKIQEKNGDDTRDTLTYLGIVHHNRAEFDLALACHNRAHDHQESKQADNPSALASSLIGIANAQWGQDNLSEALQNAEQALELNKSAESTNDFDVAMNLAVLANIHHTAGNDEQAMDLIQQALATLERCMPSDSLTLASVLNNKGVIEMRLELFTDARNSFDRALRICEKNLPEGHPKRVTMAANIQRNKEIIEEQENNAEVQS